MSAFPSLRTLFFGSVLSFACQHQRTPEQVADEYRRAWNRRDLAAIRELSDASYRARVDVARLGRFLDEADALRPRTETASVASAVARFHYADGLSLELVREDEEWRVRAGGADPDGEQEPMGALRRFLAAALSLDLETVRRFIPSSARVRFARDQDLRDHLLREQDRVRELLSLLSTSHPELSASRGEAEVHYAPGRRARLSYEAGSWRVVDLE